MVTEPMAHRLKPLYPVLQTGCLWHHSQEKSQAEHS